MEEEIIPMSVREQDQWGDIQPGLGSINFISLGYLLNSLEDLSMAVAETEDEEVRGLCEHAAGIIRKAMRLEGV